MIYRKLSVLMVTAAAVALVGCAQQTAGQQASSSVASSSDAEAMKVKEQERKIMMLERQLRERERALAGAESELQSARSTAPAASMTAGSDLFPPNPRPGECYARVIIPAQYKTTTQTIVKREASEKIEIVPAKYAPSTERVLVKPASQRIEVVPAKYGPSTERVLVKPASKRLVEVPAVYKTVTEKVLDKPAHTVWKRGTGIGTGAGAISSGYGGAAAQVERFKGQKVVETRVDDTGEVMCLVEVPASYKTITKQVLASPPTTKQIEIPAEYKTVTKQVIVSPASTRTIEIPAEYKTIETLALVQPAGERRIPIPQETATVTSTEKVSNERIEWRPVLCEVNMTAQNVSALQGALNKTGCCKCGPNRNQCQVDGVIGPCTMSAVRCYANKNGLPSGEKYVTIDVIRSLGLKF